MNFVSLRVFIVARLVISCFFVFGLWVCWFVGVCFGRVGHGCLYAGSGVCGLCVNVSAGLCACVFALAWVYLSLLTRI